MHQELQAVTTIRSGYPFRGKVPISSSSTGIGVLQPKDVDNGVLVGTPAFVEAGKVTSFRKHLLNHGDILVANKGVKFANYLYQGNPSSCIASSSFFVVAAKEDKIIPEFLQWYLNQSPAKDYLLNHTKDNTAIPSLPKSVLSLLQVPLPPLNVQHNIVNLLNAIRQEQTLLKDLIKKRDEFADSFAWELIYNYEQSSKKEH